MSFEAIWRQLQRKEPKLGRADCRVEFTSANLRALLEQVYQQGRKSTVGSDKTAAAFRDIFQWGGR